LAVLEIGMKIREVVDLETRMNKQARDEDDGEMDESDGRPWMLGAKLRNRGSLLSDW
jgi:hypothetical protein